MTMLPDGMAIPKASKPATSPSPSPKPQAPSASSGQTYSASAAGKKEKKLSMDELAAQYGYAAAMFKTDKELEKLIKQAVKEQWSTAKFQAKFMATKWYRQHSASARTWIELEARDPKEASKRINDATAAIRQQARQMGISLSASRAKQMARDSLMFGWNKQTMNNAIVSEFEYKAGKTSGATATLETFIKAQAADYGVKLSTGRIGSYLTKMLRGDFTEDHIMDLMRDQALARYPGMADLLNRGLTVADIAEPYRQSYANLLEVPDGAVSLFDNHIQKALQGTTMTAQKPGETPQMQSLYDFERALRNDSRWQYTKNARQSAMDSTLQVLRDWGLYS